MNRAMTITNDTHADDYNSHRAKEAVLGVNWRAPSDHIIKNITR